MARLGQAVEVPAGVPKLEARGLLVTPGHVDSHVHAFRWAHLISLDVDPLSSRSGVTTFVDGGSAGSLHFMAFRKFVQERVRSNPLYALLNVSAVGQMMDGIISRHGFEEVQRRGSHVVMQKKILDGTITVPVPNHDEIRIGTLQSIIRQSRIPRGEFES